MAKYKRFINDDQWRLFEPLLPKDRGSRKGGGLALDNRQVLEGILQVLRTGACWQDMPERYTSASTCWRRHRPWEAPLPRPCPTQFKLVEKPLKTAKLPRNGQNRPGASGMRLEKSTNTFR